MIHRVATIDGKEVLAALAVSDRDARIVVDDASRRRDPYGANPGRGRSCMVEGAHGVGQRAIERMARGGQP